MPLCSIIGWSGGLAFALLAIVGCFPSSFELAASEARLSDPGFELAFEGFTREEGEAVVVGRDIEYRVDSYTGVWTKDGQAGIAVFTTPAVNAMSFEANPVARMEPRELLDRVLDSTDPALFHPAFDSDTEIVVRDEKHARLRTGIGSFAGSRFSLQAEDEEFVAFVVQGRHEEDIIVIGSVFTAGGEELAEDIHRALATLEHPAPAPAGGME